MWIVRITNRYVQEIESVPAGRQSGRAQCYVAIQEFGVLNDNDTENFRELRSGGMVLMMIVLLLPLH